MYHPLRFATRGLLRFTRLVDTERQTQLAKVGEQRHPDGTGDSSRATEARWAREARQKAATNGSLTWLDILDVEMAEAYAASAPATLRAELIQVAAVCAAWIADIDSRPRRCAHCADLITGEGHNWTGPVPKPGEDEYLLPRYHLSRDYPECRRAAGQSNPTSGSGRKFDKTTTTNAVRQAAIDDGAHVHTASAETGTRCDTGDCQNNSGRKD